MPQPWCPSPESRCHETPCCCYSATKVLSHRKITALLFTTSLPQRTTNGRSNEPCRGALPMNCCKFTHQLCYCRRVVAAKLVERRLLLLLPPPCLATHCCEGVCWNITEEERSHTSRCFVAVKRELPPQICHRPSPLYSLLESIEDRRLLPLQDSDEVHQGREP